MIDKPKKALWGGILLLVLIGGGFFFKFYLDGRFRYAGTLEVTKVALAARLSAAIDDVTVHEGDRVKQGETLIKFLCEDYKIEANLAESNYQRNDRLIAERFISPIALDQYRSTKDNTKTKVNWCTLSSPIDGTVLGRHHEPGEWMLPGEKVLTLANIHDIWAYIYVPQPLIAKLSPGMKLMGYLPELKNRPFVGKILKINDEAEFTPKNVQTQSERERLVYGVKVSFLESNAEEILKPGMTIEVVLPKV